jgi:hypothetical protein
MTAYTGPVNMNPEHEHIRDPRSALLPKSYLVYHLRTPHQVNGRVAYQSEEPTQLRKWSIDELRRAHDELHGMPR